jgi:SIR2-like protein
MTADRLGINEKQATVILGAGATRGASCFKKNWVSAPLDADFFQQVQKLCAIDDSGTLGELLEFARDEFGEELDISMEKFFTQIESLDNFHETLKISRGPRVKRYGRVLTEFTAAVATVFDLLQGLTPTKLATCKYHEALARTLYSGDSILSFNYDCIIDNALRSAAGKRWNAQTSYGYAAVNFTNWHDHSGKGRLSQTPIQLLKLHGSLNWDRNHGNRLRLRNSPYEAANRARNEIVPPVWDKRIGGDAILSEIWKGARHALARGPVLVMIGYSIPETDLLSQSLLRVATTENNRKLSALVVVNPDVETRKKIIGLVGRALESKTSIYEIATLEELAPLLE